MLFTWDTNNLCIVFRQWHVRGTVSLLVSLLAVVAIGVGYEALRAGIRRYEVAINRRIEAIPSKPDPVPLSAPAQTSPVQNPIPPFFKHSPLRGLESLRGAR